MSLEEIYPQKFYIYLFFQKPREENNDEENQNQSKKENYDIEEYEVIKKTKDQLHEYGFENEVKIIFLENEFEKEIEKIFYQDYHPFCVFYNTYYPLVELIQLKSKVYQSIQKIGSNYDIILFKSLQDSNKINEWEYGQLPKLAILGKEGIMKIHQKNYLNIRTYYSDEDIFLSEWEYYFYHIINTVENWFESLNLEW